MAHALATDGKERQKVDPRLFENPEVWQACVDLAACFRMASVLGMEEGICNHLSAVVPGFDNYFIVNPFGLAFDEIRASDLIICDFEGNVVKGDRPPEITAYFIHARVHKNLPRARVAFHTHMPYATCLSMVEGQPLQWAGQTSLKFYGRTAVDEFNGLALDEKEGDRIAGAICDADVVFMRNHGVMVIGKTIAEAWNDLYYLERACQVQVLAESTGRKLVPVSPEIAAATYAQMRAGGNESAIQHLESVKRRLLASHPDYLL
ncbi:aldolase [Variovorax sp. E3]|uniref:aldolase n=1 Tax=Variovorax sp. E3 TaxID=1914993 RepID=UPI0018DE377B|nr:aldolase [Variovorax sp. E3]